MADLLLAEALLLLALDDAKGTTPSSVAVGPELAGALLLALIAAGSLVETTDALAPAGDRGAPGHPLLAEALDAVRSPPEPKKAKHWVDKLPRELKPIKGRVAASLVSRGVLAQERHKTLGLIASTRHHQADPDPGPERELRARLEGALPAPRAGARGPDGATGGARPRPRARLRPDTRGISAARPRRGPRR